MEMLRNMENGKLAEFLFAVQRKFDRVEDLSDRSTITNLALASITETVAKLINVTSFTVYQNVFELAHPPVSNYGRSFIQIGTKDYIRDNKVYLATEPVSYTSQYANVEAQMYENNNMQPWTFVGHPVYPTYASMRMELLVTASFNEELLLSQNAVRAFERYIIRNQQKNICIDYYDETLHTVFYINTCEVKPHRHCHGEKDKFLVPITLELDVLIPNIGIVDIKTYEQISISA